MTLAPVDKVTSRIDSMYQGDRIRDQAGHIGRILFEDVDAYMVEWADGSRHQYHRYTEVELLSPEPRPAVLGR